MKIGEYSFADSKKPFVIAECCNNFQDSLPIALKMVEMAAACGADAVKFQHRRRLTLDQLAVLKVCAQNHNLEFLCTVYDYAGILEIDPLVDTFKVGSAEVCSDTFRHAVADRGKPIIFSTGGLAASDVARIMKVFQYHTPGYAIMQCTSIYPTPPEYVRLGVLKDYRDAVIPNPPIVGYSDHTGLVEFPVAALALGARLVEVHFTLDKILPGPDQVVSHDPAALVKIASFACAIAVGALQRGKEFFPEEETKLSKFRGKV